ncbi:MAG: hypothetical protein AAGA48_40340 [Myxococcota bacterium]
MRPWILAILLTACEDNGFTLVGPNEPTPLEMNDTGSGSMMSGPACSQIQAQGLCTDFVGSSYTELEVQSNCAGGTVRPDCPDEDLLGVCGLQVGTVFETRTHYYLGPFFSSSNIDGAESQCLLKGGDWL